MYITYMCICEIFNRRIARMYNCLLYNDKSYVVTIARTLFYCVSLDNFHCIDTYTLSPYTLICSQL